MITDKYLRHLNNLNTRAGLAMRMITGIKVLKLKTDTSDTIKELESIITDYEISHNVVLDYLMKLVPEELVKQLTVKRISGAFITDTTGTISFNTELTLHLGDDNIHLKFDNDKKCFYHQLFKYDKYFKLFDKYLEFNSKYNAWINLK